MNKLKNKNPMVLSVDAEKAFDEIQHQFLFFFFLFFFFFCLFRAAPVAYGGSQGRGLIGTVAAGLC